jgi:hypothetical protein
VRKFALTFGWKKRIGKPSIEKSWQREQISFLAKTESSSYWWMPYPLSETPKRSYYREIFDQECYLVEIAEDILNFINSDEPEASYSEPDNVRAFSLYNRLVWWRLSLPDCLQPNTNEIPQALHIL